MGSILHILPTLTTKQLQASLAPALSFFATDQRFTHTLMTLQAPEQDLVELVRQSGINFLSPKNRSEIYRQLSAFEIIHIHCWNTPELYALLNEDLPASRLLLSAESGTSDFLQLPFDKLRDFADEFVLEPHYGPENGLRSVSTEYANMLNKPKRKRFWGLSAALPISKQPLTISDLLQGVPSKSGADLYIESLGSAANEFKASKNETVLSKQFDVETGLMYLEDQARIEALLAYKEFFQSDAWLRFWSGLILLGRSQNQLALIEFQEAARLGFLHWRVDWYGSIAALRARDFLTAATLLQKVLEREPGWDQARQLLRSLNSESLVVRKLDFSNLDWAREVHCTVLGYGNAKLLMDLVLKLNICSFWRSFEQSWKPVEAHFRVVKNQELHPDNYLSELDPERDFSFAEPVCVRISPELSLPSTASFLVSSDIHASMLRHFELHRSLMGSGAEYALEDALDLPLLQTEGGLFGLAPIEEWYLQERLLSELLPGVHRLTERQLRKLDLETLQSILQVLRVGRSQPELERALKSLRPQPTEDEKPQEPAITKRIESLDRALGRGSGVNQAHTNWNSTCFSTAQSAWVRSQIAKLTKQLGKPELTFAGLIPVLEQLCTQLEQLPLLEIGLCRALLQSSTEVIHATDRLRELSHRGSRFIKIAATAVLLEHNPNERELIVQKSFFLSQLDTAGSHSQLDYFQDANRMVSAAKL